MNENLNYSPMLNMSFPYFEITRSPLENIVAVPALGQEKIISVNKIVRNSGNFINSTNGIILPNTGILCYQVGVYMQYTITANCIIQIFTYLNDHKICRYQYVLNTTGANYGYCNFSGSHYVIKDSVFSIRAKMENTTNDLTKIYTRGTEIFLNYLGIK